MIPPERRVSFVEWIQGSSPHKQIILQGHGAYAELTKAYVEGIVGVVSAMVNSVEMADDPNRKIWFIADEFGQMGKIPVRPLFEVGRSRGVRCIVACQDFAQLEEIHGAPFVRALVGMCGTLLVGQIMQGETAEALCKAFGAREVERANVSSSSGGSGSGSGGSTTLSYNRDEVPLYKASELTSRLGLTHDGSGVVMLLFTGGNAYELRWPLYDMRRERLAHCPAPWTLGLSGMEPLPAPSLATRGVSPALRTLAPDGTAPPTASPSDPSLPDRLAAGQSAEPMDAVAILGELDSLADVGSGVLPASVETAGKEGPSTRLSQQRQEAEQEPEPKAAKVSDPRQPTEALIVEAVSHDGQAMSHAHEAEPLFDAAAELAAVNFGHAPIGLAIELATALDASTPAASGPQQRVHMGQAQRGGSSADSRHGAR